MTKPATIRKSDLKRYAEIANEQRVKVIVKSGDMTVTVVPDYVTTASSGIDYSKPIL